MADKVLIYRLGSLGDTVVALPSMHLIARAFPNAERRVLTNFPVNGKAAPMEDIIGKSGLVHGYFKYPTGSRKLADLFALRSAIRSWRPDIVIYLAAPRGRRAAVRDAAFFYSCGVKRIVGLPFRRSDQKVRRKDSISFEREAERLTRMIAAVGDGQVDAAENWNLLLNGEEHAAALRILNDNAMKNFVVVSAGTKADSKDWGRDNWTQFLSALAQHETNIALVLVGSPDEAVLSDDVSTAWRGRRLNLCGLLNPRVTAALIERALLFVGHDSGPMHLAAAVGTPCVAIFSARNLPGEWFPFGFNHTVIYHQTECYGCELVKCVEHQKKCIMSITVNEVLNAVTCALAKRRDQYPPTPALR